MKAKLLILLVFAMTVIGCDNGPTNDKPQTDDATRTVKYESSDDAGNTYILVIMEKTSRAAYTGAEGDSYVLTIKQQGQPDKESKGVVSTIKADGELTLKPTKADDTFGVKINDGKMAAITGTITLEDGEEVPAPGAVTPVGIGSAKPIEMIYVPGGSFEMGNPDTSVGFDDERPVHTVTLSGFYMSKYPVTQAQYQEVMGSNPSEFSSDPASGEVQGNRPVECVSWYDAIVFCNKLSIAEDKSPAYRISGSTNPSDWGTVPTSRNNSTWDAVEIVSGSTGYRLPTEAQWEYAAKGGNGTPGNYTYSGSNTVGDVAWYGDNSASKTHEVGKKLPNGLGIYDMSGNVWEWCWDWLWDYSSGAQTDPVEAASTGIRMVRGGSWFDVASDVRSVIRFAYFPGDRFDICVGFRLVRP